MPETITIAPQHDRDIDSLSEAYIIERVAYSPLKVTYAHHYPSDIQACCKSCEWTTTIAALPDDAGTVVPDMCPDCAKDGGIGHVRTQSPADGTLPVGYEHHA